MKEPAPSCVLTLTQAFFCTLLSEYIYIYILGELYLVNLKVV